jgi:hypothetical protein
MRYPAYRARFGTPFDAKTSQYVPHPVLDGGRIAIYAREMQRFAAFRVKQKRLCTQLNRLAQQLN